VRDFGPQTVSSLKPYIKDSGQLIGLIDEHTLLVPNASLFVADANSMYANIDIDTDDSLQVNSKWLNSIQDQLPNDFPLTAVNDAHAQQ